MKNSSIKGDSSIINTNPFLSSIMQLFKIQFLEFLIILKDHIFKSMRYFLVFKECPVEIQTSVFQIKIPLFYCKLFNGSFF